MLLAGCAAQTPPGPVCPVVIELSGPLQDSLADELEALPRGFVGLQWALLDWARMRDEARAICGLERMRADDD